MYNFEPNYAIPPSETLKEVFDDRKIEVSNFSKETGIDLIILQDLMDNKCPINEDIATKLESGLRIPKSFWLNLERNYRETFERLEKSKGGNTNGNV